MHGIYVFSMVLCKFQLRYIYRYIFIKKYIFKNSNYDLSNQVREKIVADIFFV